MDLIVGMFNFIYHMKIVIKTGVYIITIIYIMDLIVGMFNFIYHMHIVIKTGVYIITVSISMPL